MASERQFSELFQGNQTGMQPSSSGYTPCEMQFGFVIRSSEKCVMNDYLRAVATITGAENVMAFCRIRSNYGVWVKNAESAEKLMGIDFIKVNSERSGLLSSR